MRNRDVYVFEEADVHRFAAAFINFDLRNDFTAVVELGRIECLQRPVEQFAAFGSAGFGGIGTDNDGNDASAVAFAGSGEVVACAFGMSCLQAVHIGIAVEQEVAVWLFDIVVLSVRPLAAGCSETYWASVRHMPPAALILPVCCSAYWGLPY